MISLIRRWLKAGILEGDEIHPNEEGTPRGGSISVLPSNLYLHNVLDPWFERVVKPRLRGEAYLVRYIDGIAGNFRALQKVHRFVERYWRKMLNSRSREGSVTWEVFHKIKERFPLQRPGPRLNHVEFQSFAVL